MRPLEKSPRPSGTLFSAAARQLGAHARDELALGRAEIGQSLGRAGVGLALIAGAALLTLTALHMLAGAAVAALSAYGIAPHWAALLVALAFLLAAVALGLIGRAALRPRNLIPRKTLRNLQRDAQSLKEILGNG